MTTQANRRYAAGTSVDPMKTRMEIERTIRRFGARDFAVGVRDGQPFVTFTVGIRTMRFVIPEPDVEVKQYPQPTYGKRLQLAIEAEQRRLWRSMAMAIKSKLDIIESGIATIETELLPYVVRRDGRTVGEAAADDEGFQSLISASPIALSGGRE